MIKKILIANRGEIACRIIKTAKKMNIKTVAVYSEADKYSDFVSMADESYFIGPSAPSESYLVIKKIIEIAKRSKSDAIHPGYGFLSENYSFVKALEKEKIKFIGPNKNAIIKMGDKIESKNLAVKLKLNVIPGHTEAVRDPKKAIKIAEKIGFPVLLKASAGGGGKGMRIVNKRQELETNLKAAQSEALNSFGDDRVFIEKYITNPRHIEIQILCDKHGNQLHLGERECSIQRRYQKVIEECPSSFVDNNLREAMAEQALRLAKEVKYDSAGTVEFVVDDKKNFYFLEMNTRLQVEHPVTELVTGVDLVEQMINCADGKKLTLSQNDIKLNGWSIESRIYAEDPLKEFLPSIGRLIEHQEPSIFNKDEIIRNDTGVSSGSEISIFYDPMISKLAVHAKDRDKALDLMISALEQYYIEGVEHNVAFLISTLKNKDFRNGAISTNFIKSHYPNGYIYNYGINKDILKKFFNVAALVFLKVNGNKVVKNISIIKGADIVEIEIIEYSFSNKGANIKLKQKNEMYEIQSDWSVNEKIMQMSVNQNNEFAKIDKIHNFNKYSITIEDCSLDLIVSSLDTGKLFKYMPEPKVEDLSKMLISPMPGLIKDISVKEGQKIKKGEQIVIIEAMKMENILKSEKDCLVREILVKEGDSVSADEVLINFE
ncbi:MAG: acetyl/propionyl-CoA carboxylase subunit alpha [Pelagibacteraceae bacterium]|nr:acetyl/propionyl-CoA carboxylase subunit alpha [Pelagibacteraceae bacterium]